MSVWIWIAVYVKQVSQNITPTEPSIEASPSNTHTEQRKTLRPLMGARRHTTLGAQARIVPSLGDFIRGTPRLPPASTRPVHNRSPGVAASPRCR